jgi:hypothetical protein
MKELIEIIDHLHKVNEQIVEKDNMINNMSSIIELVSQLMADADFIKSDIYLDLRAKYISQIQDRLKKMENANIVIEPENPTMEKTVKDIKGKITNKFTKEQVRAPIKTDIFVAPNCRRTYARKKIKKDANGKDTKDTKDTKDRYISFEYEGSTYYIYIDTDESHKDTHDVYNSQFSMVGNLEKDEITIITDNEKLLSRTIKLSTVPEGECIFGKYTLLN